MLDTDWSFLNVIQDVHTATDLFYSKLYELLDNYVPKFRTFKRNYPKWYSSEIIKNIRQKSSPNPNPL